MAFVNLSLLLGGVLTAVPIVLHLVMRQQPKRVVFPALRFLQQRRETNRRRLRLRQWLLLVLRCAAIVLLVLAFARPSVDSAAIGGWIVAAMLLTLVLVAGAGTAAAALQHKGYGITGALGAITALLAAALMVTAFTTLRNSSGVLLGDQQAPVAAAFVFDTSPRMLYRLNNQTRLDVAQEMANWLARQLPVDSDLAIIDSRPGPAVFSVDLASAEKAISRLQPSGVTESLGQVVSRALQVVSGSEKSRKEIYVFSDLSSGAWDAKAATSLKPRLADSSDVTLYVIDVGAEAPSNVAIGELQLSAETVARNNEVSIETELINLGSSATRAVELLLEEPDDDRPIVVDGQTRLPEEVRRDRREVAMDRDSSTRVRFRLPSLPPGVHNGCVRLDSTDNLSVDDTRYFTIEVKEAWPILVVAPKGVVTSFLVETLSPFEFRQSDQARFECTVADQSDLSNRNLDSFAAVCLLDPQPLTPPQWNTLNRYVERGGGLAVFLGHNASQLSSFNDPAARQVLGGRLSRKWRSAGRDLLLAPTNFSHPILAMFRDRPTSVPWSESPIFFHWGLGDLIPEASVVIPFGNGKPGLVEVTRGAGHIFVMTTPVSDPYEPPGRPSWNELPTSQSWPYLVLINELFLQLVGSTESRLNYATGEIAVLVNDPDRDPDRYELFPPEDQPLDVSARGGELTVRSTGQPGIYRLKGDRGGPVLRGFAVNLPIQASSLERVSREELDELIGSDRYQYARSRDEIELEVGEARVGHEFYPYLLAILAVVCGMESLLANRFYRTGE